VVTGRAEIRLILCKTCLGRTFRIFRTIPRDLAIIQNSQSPRYEIAHLTITMEKPPSIFGERYRVVAIEGDRLVIRGVHSGKVLTIVNPEPETPLTPEEYPPGKLIALTDPSQATPN
jgi:hypothetical protein